MSVWLFWISKVLAEKKYETNCVCVVHNPKGISKETALFRH